MKYPFFRHGSLNQKQQSIHKDLYERKRQKLLHINSEHPISSKTGYRIVKF